MTDIHIDKSKLPVHVAIIMDGNGRWAKKKGLPRIYGHRAGIKSVRTAIETARELEIKVLSLFAFSTENWTRPAGEIGALMGLLSRYLKKEKEEMKNKGIRFVVSGDISALPAKVRQEVRQVCEYTEDCRGLVLNLCLNYGGRQEILHAVNMIASLERTKKTQGIIDESAFRRFLWTGNLPDPDLLIRTSGERRVSNFLLWQIAYAELYFTPVLWPDFNRNEFYRAIKDYQTRERRFGSIQ
ncbi:MAG: isoprenyl transferase [Elusimicrobiota bacterium]